jgi:putative endonuclease
MASVYILHSEKLGKFYIGSCDDLFYRIQQHHLKEFVGSFTAKASDWELFLSVDNLEYQRARLIESHIKRMKSRKYILNLKSYPKILLKLIERYNK